MRKNKRKIIITALISLILGMIVGFVRLPESEAYTRIKTSLEIKRMSNDDLMALVQTLSEDELETYVTTMYRPEAEKVYKYYYANKLQIMMEEDVFPEVIEP